MRRWKNTSPLPDSVEGLVQFVFDNADANIATATGHGTFHAIGGHNGDDTSFPSWQFSISASGNDRGSLSHWQLQQYSVKVLQNKASHTALLELPLLPWPLCKLKMSSVNLDYLWIAGFYINFRSRPSWAGLMQTANKTGKYEKASFVSASFINRDPT